MTAPPWAVVYHGRHQSSLPVVPRPEGQGPESLRLHRPIGGVAHVHGDPLVLQDVPGEGLAAFTQNPDGKIGGEVRWKKTGLDSPISISTKAGELKVPAGHTWIELVPAANGDVTFGK